MEDQKQEESKEKVVPSLSFSEDKVVIETIDVPLIVDNKEVMIKMRKLTAGERREIVKQTANIRVVGKTPTGSMDSIGYQIGVLAKVIMEAPFKPTEPVLSSFPATVTDYLFSEYEAFAENKKKD